MKIKGIIDEDFVNYKLPSMVIMTPSCTFKCDKESGKQVCQNGALATAPSINIGVHSLIYRYLHNPITKAIVIAGLEPFDSFGEVAEFITMLRKEYKCDDDIVIYTGYKKEESEHWIQCLQTFANIVVKFGRFIPDQQSHYDEVLGVKLASDNQFAERIS